MYLCNLPVCLRQSLLLNSELTDSASLARQGVPGSSLSAPTQDLSIISLLFLLALGIWTQVLMLKWQALYWLSQLPSPEGFQKVPTHSTRKAALGYEHAYESNTLCQLVSFFISIPNSTSEGVFGYLHVHWLICHSPSCYQFSLRGADHLVVFRGDPSQSLAKVDW